jgi:uncharacterized membrane protein
LGHGGLAALALCFLVTSVTLDAHCLIEHVTKYNSFTVRRGEVLNMLCRDGCGHPPQEGSEWAANHYWGRPATQCERVLVAEMQDRALYLAITEG